MDILNDTNYITWLHINEKIAERVPGYVNNYTPITKEASSTLADSQWADDINKLYPIDSKENTWISAA